MELRVPVAILSALTFTKIVCQRSEVGNFGGNSELEEHLYVCVYIYYFKLRTARFILVCII